MELELGYILTALWKSSTERFPGLYEGDLNEDG